MKFKKCYFWVLICVFCSGICLGAVVITYKLYNKIGNGEICFNIGTIDFSAIATFFTGIIALLIAFISPIIAKKYKSCCFDIKMTDKFPYFNATPYMFFDFDNQGIYQGTNSASETFIYRFGVLSKKNTAEKTVVAIEHFRLQGNTDDVLGFLPMRLRWSYKDETVKQNDKVIENKIYPGIEQYCDFCFVKKSPNSKDYFLSLCGEYSGPTGQSICNCIFDNGIYEVEIIIAADNCKNTQKYLIIFSFNCAPHSIGGHPSMFNLIKIKEIHS